MKKILMLSCSTGEGHNSAAYAIESVLTREGISCELADPVSFQSQRTQTVVASLYNDTIRKAPAIFGAVYKLGDIYCASKLPSPVYWANARYSKALKEYIVKNEFDAVICTHLYGMEAMTAIRKDPDFTVPSFGVLTDYVCIPFLEETDLTRFFVPNQEVKDYLIGKGKTNNQVVITGIPVNEMFRVHHSKEDARKLLDIDIDKHIFLVMTGGVGCENMESLCCKLLSELQDKDQMIVLTGKNDVLKERLDQKYAGNSRIRTVAFTRQVADYMAASDVILSKPGGLSSTEAAAANVPLVHIHAIPGCETHNAKYFSQHGMSLYASSETDAVKNALTLAHNHQAAEEMKCRQRELIYPDAAVRIVEEVKKVCSATN